MGHRMLLPVTLAVLLWSLPGIAKSEALELKDCRIHDATGAASIPAECGYFTVPENPDEPQGKTVALFVARIPTLNKQRSEQAFTLLAGGPGQAASEAFVAYSKVLQRVRSSHDILLVDQRGTGKSNRLACDSSPEDALLEWDEERATEILTKCRDALSGDPRYYTTSVAVQDLDAVREALGYRQMVVYGGSYGTRVAQHYLRRFPEHTQGLILDGVVPADMALGPRIALDAQHALDVIFDRCKADAECNSTFPDLAAAFERLKSTLRSAPVELQLTDPNTGITAPATLSYGSMAGAVRLLSYRPESAALLPLLINEADKGNYGPLTAQGMMVMESMEEAIAYGMHNAVVCAEDAPFFNRDEIDMEALEKTYLGKEQVTALETICKIWPRGLADPDIKEPLVSDKPVLLLSGEADPVTPPEYAERVAAHLSNARHLVGPGQGHGMLGVGCIPRLVTDFVKDPSLESLDGECVKRLGPSPFFLDFNGPTP